MVRLRLREPRTQKEPHGSPSSVLRRSDLFVNLGYYQVFYYQPPFPGRVSFHSDRWLDYSGKAQRRGASVLKKLERLVDDFGWLNFQEGGGAGSEMVVALLDKASFGSSTLTTPQLAMATTEKIKEVYFTLELWYFSMRQKVRLLLRKAASMIEYDLLEVVNEFIEFYGEFVEK